MSITLVHRKMVVQEVGSHEIPQKVVVVLAGMQKNCAPQKKVRPRTVVVEGIVTAAVQPELAVLGVPGSGVGQFLSGYASCLQMRGFQFPQGQQSSK